MCESVTCLSPCILECLLNSYKSLIDLIDTSDMSIDVCFYWSMHTAFYRQLE